MAKSVSVGFGFESSAISFFLSTRNKFIRLARLLRFTESGSGGAQHHLSHESAFCDSLGREWGMAEFGK